MPALPERLQAALADRYALQRELGRGGMATVYLAEDRKHRRPVAIKVLKPELAAALGPERFLREIELSARLTHPHILPLHDSGEAEGVLYYVMPYVDGESLRDRLNREKQLALDDALLIAREVADALGYAHSRGVVHRDIKPENILLQSGHAVVGDFGIARAITAAGGDRLTATGIALGTPAYMSPEQAAGSAELDGRTDVYSLGCLLYEMLAGRPPFTGPTVESVVHQQLAAEPPAITGIRPTVPDWVAAALARALAKTPADRFHPVAQLAEALRQREAAAPAASARAVVPTHRSWRRLAPIGLAVALVAAGALLIDRCGARAPEQPAFPHTAIAVLPLQNLSAEGPHAYFAGGLHDELLTQLSKVAALKVISRTSVMGYASTSTPLKQIADELGVGSVVEGSVQVVGGRLRVTVQLIDAATDAPLWAERYDRTLDDAFTIQSDVAQQIVAAVGATLTGAEQRELARPPTANAEAYRLYLQGREYFNRPSRLRQDYEIAQQLYERALALDPEFALAHVALGEVHALMYILRYDPSPARVALATQQAETALRLVPDLPEAHAAMAWAHGLGRGDFRRQLEALTTAVKGAPNDARLWQRIGFTHRRLGNWNDALAAFERTTQLDPRDPDLFLHEGITYDLMHRYADAMHAYDRALSLAPDLHTAGIWKGWAYVRWQGQLDSLRAALSRVPESGTLGSLAGGDVGAQRAAVLLWERRADSLLRIPAVSGVAVFEGEFSFLPAALYVAWAHQAGRDPQAAGAAFESALGLLDSVLPALGDDWRVHTARGLALAGLGRRVEAQWEALWLQQSAVYREGFYGPPVAEGRARILAQIGEADAAIDEVERLIGGPSWLTVHTLRLDPLWDPIRNHRRFRALLTQ